MGNSSELSASNSENALVDFTEKLLVDVKDFTKNNNKVLSVPVSELLNFGSGLSSLIPACNTVTQTITIPTDGLYKIANKAAGDTLKYAKNGNLWGSLRKADGGSRMMQISKMESLQGSMKTALPFNPTLLMMAVAIYSIEKDMKKIKETQEKILTFMEVENESQIEADVESLMGIASTYKCSWDNEISVTNNHKLVIDIKNRARKNIIAYQKKITDILLLKKFIVSKSNVNSTLSDLGKRFKYYRLSLYIFSLSSLMEIMLSGNFSEEYISNAENEIKKLSDDYCEKFEKSSLYLEELGNSEVEVNVVKAIGTAGTAVGKLIGGIPLVKDGSVDEFLQDKGNGLHENANAMGAKAVKEFAVLRDPETKVFVEKMEDITQIYNRTSQICVDKEKIYLL